ncbi:MAG: Ig-like domain-containing protein, partial [Candidatus Palauibacterales bacterium]|nr:Ig-like domain-containing protein [Candidatus Palauibacterales bacterium]
MTCAAVLLALASCGTPPVMGPADPPPSASPSVAQVMVKPQSVSLGVQDTVDLTATALDDQGNPIPDASISWSVSDTSVVSLNNGQAKGKKTGSTTITASSDGKKGHSKVNVKKGSGTVTLSLTPQADTLAPGDTVRLDAEVTDGSGQPISGVTFNW